MELGGNEAMEQRFHRFAWSGVGRALGLLGQMEARGGRPDAVSYSAAISACERAGQCGKALELFGFRFARSIPLTKHFFSLEAFSIIDTAFFAWCFFNNGIIIQIRIGHFKIRNFEVF